MFCVELTLGVFDHHRFKIISDEMRMQSKSVRYPNTNISHFFKDGGHDAVIFVRVFVLGLCVARRFVLSTPGAVFPQLRAFPAFEVWGILLEVVDVLEVRFSRTARGGVRIRQIEMHDVRILGIGSPDKIREV